MITNKRGCEEIKNEIKKDFYLNKGKKLKSFLIELNENWKINLSINLLSEILNISTYRKAKELNQVLENQNIKREKISKSKKEIVFYPSLKEIKDFSHETEKINICKKLVLEQKERIKTENYFILRV